ncbi:MAG TPA: ABC transporter substrate-binding protein [Spirochaetota bacterium]|nr:ABC transporter substrate-binding protein [Spirochaetota bacterium]HOM38865.1 ABC transporter substrate-binding protein [Spirochaetota bacterium]HPQ49160.1 ABC transporter substrate-binding protein [Spirochaetota bacterium]
MKRFFYLLFFILLIISACSKGDTIKIGVIVPKSGQLATYGIEAMNGIQIAAEKINNQGGIEGIKIELIIEDNQGTTTESINAYKKLVTLSGVNAVIGPVTSGNGIAVKPLVAQYKTPLISPTGTAVVLTEGNEYLSRTCFIDPFQGKAAASFAYNELGKKTAVIMYDSSNDYSVELADAFENEFKKLGGKIVYKVGFKDNDRDFNPQLTEIIKFKPEIIYVPSYHPTAGPIINQAKQKNIDAIFIGGDGWDSPKLKELAGEGYSGNYFTTHFSEEDIDPMVQDFVKTFKSKTGLVPGAMAALGYDAVYMLSHALKNTIKKMGKEKIGTQEFKDELKNNINSTKELKGITGTITLDENRNPIKSVVIIKTTPEGPRFYKKIDL